MSSCNETGMTIADMRNLLTLRLYFQSLLYQGSVIFLLMKVDYLPSSPCVLVPSDLETRHDADIYKNDLIQGNCSVLAGLSSGAVCETEPEVIALGTCAQGLFRCQEGHCILGKYACDGKTQCPDSSDEADCFHVCAALNGTLSASSEYCFKDCQQPLCDCSWDYFQCQMGGCVAWWTVCDCVEDCLDGSDEKQCTSCRTAFQQLTTYHKVSSSKNVSCPSAGYSLCGTEPNECFPQAALCIYEPLSPNGIQHCSNGEHLQNCYYFECPTFYKCFNTYCIPLYRMCNGEADCPDGDDERFCAEQTCPDMLTCSAERYCVHPRDLQNGLIQCPVTADDEDVYISQICPESCVCKGDSIKCDVFDHKKLNVVYHSVKKLHLSGARFKYTKDTFDTFPALLGLDISQNNLSHIYDGSFANQQKLIGLNLANNHLTHINHRHLSGLDNIRNLNLRNNPITVINSLSFSFASMVLDFDLSQLKLTQVAPKAFDGMKHCATLNLSNNLLYEIAPHTFYGMPALSTLDLRDNPLRVVSPDEFYKIRTLFKVYMPRRVFCCKGSFNGACSPSGGSIVCEFYIVSRVVKGTGWLNALLSCAFSAAFLFAEAQNKTNSLFTLNVLKNVMGILLGFTIIFLLMMDLSFQGSFAAVYETTLLTNPACLVASSLYIISFQMLFLLSTVLTVFKAIAVLWPLHTKTVLTSKTVSLTISVCGVFIGILTPLLLSHDARSHFAALGPSCGIIVSSKDQYPVTYSILLGFNALLILVIICVSLSTVQSLLGGVDSLMKTQKKSISIDKRKAARRTLIFMAQNSTGMLLLILVNIMMLTGIEMTRDLEATLTIIIFPMAMLLTPGFEAFAIIWGRFVDTYHSKHRKDKR